MSILQKREFPQGCPGKLCFYFHLLNKISIRKMDSNLKMKIGIFFKKKSKILESMSFHSCPSLTTRNCKWVKDEIKIDVKFAACVKLWGKWSIPWFFRTEEFNGCTPSLDLKALLDFETFRQESKDASHIQRSPTLIIRGMIADWNFQFGV